MSSFSKKVKSFRAIEEDILSLIFSKRQISRMRRNRERNILYKYRMRIQEPPPPHPTVRDLYPSSSHPGAHSLGLVPDATINDRDKSTSHSPGLIPPDATRCDRGKVTYPNTTHRRCAAPTVLESVSVSVPDTTDTAVTTSTLSRNTLSRNRAETSSPPLDPLAKTFLPRHQTNPLYSSLLLQIGDFPFPNKDDAANLTNKLI